MSEDKVNLVYYTIYKKLKALGILSITEHKKYSSKGFMDLSIDVLENSDEKMRIAMAHNFIPPKATRGKLMNEHDKKLMDEKETLRFQCGACKREWVEERPQDQYIRSGNDTNYYINAGGEQGPRHPIHCPKCNDPAQIRRIPPPMRPSTDGYHDTRKAMTKWATNPITQEEMLGEREIP